MRNRSLSVLLTHSSVGAPPPSDSSAWPWSTISSAGVVLTKTFGVVLAESFLPGSAALTSFQLSSAGSFEKLSGSLPAGVHGPLTSVACSHELL